MREINIKADLYSQSYSIYPLKQWDATDLMISVYASKEPYSLEGLGVTLNALLSDGTSALMQKGVEVTEPNVIKVRLADEVTALPGEVRFELVISRNGEQISTYTFRGTVEAALIGGGVPVVWEDVSGNIYKALALANAAAEALREQTDAAGEISANIELYLNAIDEALSKMEQYDGTAAESARSAVESAAAALVSANAAYQSQTAAESARKGAEDTLEGVVLYHEQIEQMALKVTDNADAVTKMRDEAQSLKESAGISESSAAGSAVRAEESAKKAETEAGKSAVSASSASGSAASASGSAANSANSASNAAASAATASTKANEASVSATTAGTHKTAAEAAAVTAAGKAEEAKESASEAAESAEKITGELSKIDTLKDVIYNDLTAPISSTGTVAMINDVIGGLPLKISADIVSTQSGSGDPSPDNIRQISGIDNLSVWHTGKNLWTTNASFPIFSGTLNYDRNTQTYTLTRAAGSTSGSASIYKLPVPIPAGTVVSLSVVILSGMITTESVYIRGYHSGGSSQGIVTIPMNQDLSGKVITATTTTTDTVTDFWIVSSAKTVTEEPLVFRVMYQLGAPTAYEPFSGNTYNIALPEIVYGVSGYPSTVDLSKGTLAKQGMVMMILDGTENWNLPTAVTAGYSNYRLNTFFSEVPRGFICSHFVSSLDAYYSTPPHRNRATQYPGTLQLIIQVSNGIADSQSQTSATAWKAYLAAQYAAGTPVQLLYALATEQTITIVTPPEILSLSGTNIVYTNGGGNVTVEGRQGWKPFVVKLTNAIIELGGIL